MAGALAQQLAWRRPRAGAHGQPMQPSAVSQGAAHLQPSTLKAHAYDQDGAVDPFVSTTNRRPRRLRPPWWRPQTWTAWPVPRPSSCTKPIRIASIRIGGRTEAPCGDRQAASFHSHHYSTARQLPKHAGQALNSFRTSFSVVGWSKERPETRITREPRPSSPALRLI